MKRTFQKKAESNEIENQFQEKFSECLTQLRNGFNELIERRKEYKIAKQSKKFKQRTVGRQPKKVIRSELSSAKSESLKRELNSNYYFNL